MEGDRSGILLLFRRVPRRLAKEIRKKFRFEKKFNLIDTYHLLDAYLLKSTTVCN
jgi:hypothetical protein